MSDRTVTTEQAGITVIIPTMCEAARRTSIMHAIESVLTQQGVNVMLVIMVNGKRFDPDLLKLLKSRSDLKVEYLEEASHAKAQQRGRACVETDFFAFLDDDDILLPNALAIRAAPMLNDDTLDLVATNGIWDIEGGRARVEQPERVNEDPLKSLLLENWLASCGGLYRTKSITLDYFDGKTKYFEWTLLAFRISISGKRILFLDVPTYQINDSLESVSKSTAYGEAFPGFLLSLAEYNLPSETKSILQKKIAAAWHTLSEHYRTRHDWKNAWLCHLRSLLTHGGWRYLSYTRHLLKGN